MSFLAPLFLVGLAALAIPVLIHLVQRERRRVVEFPSLMFLQRLPYRSVRRRRIQNWFLLLVRLAALALIVAAFGRPFLKRPDLAAAATAGAREIVVLLDNSYSMAYGTRWQTARANAREVVSKLGAADRVSLLLFASEPQLSLRSTQDRGRVLAAIEAAEPTPGATRYGPALKLASSILSASPLSRREVVLISDFQRSGWRGAEDVRLPQGATATAMPVEGDETASNVAVTPVTLERSTFADQERVVVTSGALNRSGRAVSNLALALEINGRVVETQRVNLEPHGSSTVSFAPVTIASRHLRGTVRIPPDALAWDNSFHFVVSRSEPTRVLVVERDGPPPEATLYLQRALKLGEAPRFDVVVKRAAQVTSQDLATTRLLVLNDVPATPALAAPVGDFVKRGGGLFVVLGRYAAWPATDSEILPVLPTAVVDRSARDVGRLGVIEYAHPVFEVFRTPRSGDFSVAHFYGYRAVEPVSSSRRDEPSDARDRKTSPTERPETGATRDSVPPAAESPVVAARFDDGAPALVERRVGAGRVLVWTSTVDLSWNNFALTPVFLPFIHRVARHLCEYTESAPWFTVGQVTDVSLASRPSATESGGRFALAPSGQRVEFGTGADVLHMTEQGFYEIRRLGRDAEAAMTLASNVDLSESDLAKVDHRELTASLRGSAPGGTSARVEAAPSEQAQERAQRIWWYLLLLGVLLLGLDTILANRLSRTA
jgi:hypothetical protein